MTGVTQQWLRSLGAETDIVQSGPPTVALWGVAPTGSIHLGYAAFLLLLRRLEAAGAKIVLLVANYHGYLDSSKAAWEVLDERTAYYNGVFADAGFVNTVETRSFYRSDAYVEELFRFSRACVLRDAVEAGQGTLRADHGSATVADALYVTTQVLDPYFLRSNLVICGMDEAPIYRYGLPLLRHHYEWNSGYIYLPACPGITEPEMHASDPSANKILLSADADEVRRKIVSHTERYPTPSPLQMFCERTLFPLAGRDDLVARLGSDERDRPTAASITLTEGIWDVLLSLRGAIGP